MPVKRDVKIVRHSVESPSSPQELKAFLCSGFHTAIAADDTAGLPTLDGPSPGQSYQDVIDSIPKAVDIAVLFEHSEAQAHGTQLREKAAKDSQLIIAPLGHNKRSDGYFNSVAVAWPGADLLLLDKISFSFDDLAWAKSKQETLSPGTELHVFQAKNWKLAVLNCHDYTHADLVRALLLEDVDIIVVTTRNQASRLYDEYAIADIHRLCCFVVINNVSDYGGSGVYAPFSRVGDKNKAVTLGGTLFSTRGPTEVSAVVPLPLKELRDLRTQFQGRNRQDEHRYRHIDPPEQVKFFPDPPPYRSVIAKPGTVEVVDLNELGYRRQRTAPVRIAIAQLQSMTMDDYLDNSYRLSRSTHRPAFESRILSHLHCLTELQAENRPDFLVFPEVFLPFSLESKIKELASSWNTIVIAGFEYDEQEEKNYGTANAQGINRCRVYIPTSDGVTTKEYVKLTRSQYDARFKRQDGDWGSFPMTLGNQLLRFVADGLGTFGVLICYDLSHFDLVSTINLGTGTGPGQRLTPLDTLFIVAHNPYAELYRRCCLADCHRFYQYVVMCNVAQYGSSGIFGPLRTSGDRRTLLYAGKNAEGIFCADVDVNGLETARASEDDSLGSTPPKWVVTNLNNERQISFQRRPGCLVTCLPVNP